ncbi:MAG TPA: NAD(P)/FAD-dependent oxidoreductase [Ktedonobacteraceae bacterium]|jgi:cation diffusion facilitator CzcD-associated flavoprotein CzcO
MTRAFAQSGAKAPLSTESSQPTPLPRESSSDEQPVRHFRVAILGTGFAGLGMAIQLKQHGSTDFVVLEKAADVGGTWRDNTYPGCACDVQSHLYSFSFAPNPRWSHMYSSQPEIWAYLRDCTERFGMRPFIRWNSEIVDAHWNEEEQRWLITTTQGQLTANVLILGNGPLSEPSLPAIPGIEQFAGTLFHSARWRHDYDLTGKRVAVIGTGASSIQFVPRIQPQVARLTLFQRTAPWIMPRQDHPIKDWQRRLFRFLPFAQRLIRTRIYWQRELLALGFLRGTDLLKKAEQLALDAMHRQVADPELRAKLTPHYAMGCKRILLSDDFYPALTQPNVELVTERIREVRAGSIVTEDGQEHEIDTIICGTGFHVTDTAFAGCVYGRDGQSLADRWGDAPDAYLGTAVSGFPNLFLLIGPNTGLGHSSMVFMIEAHVAYILDCLHIMERRNWQTVEIKPEVQEAFNAEVQQRMQGTIWNSGCKSWYIASSGRNTTLWPGFTFDFRRRTRHFDRQSYQTS